MTNHTTHDTAVGTNVQHLIEVQNIGKDYQEGESTVQAIKEMTFYVDDGEFVAIMGQSGSGKTFALGIILEQLLLETDLRMVVIDPNSDFISLNQLRTLDEVNRTPFDSAL